VWEIARHELYLKRNVEISSSSSVARYPRRVNVFPLCSPPAIPILHYLSPINNSHLSHVILYIILSSTRGSPLGIFLMYNGLFLRSGQSGDRIPVGARLSAPVQTGPAAHPDSCTLGTGSFPGVICGRGVTLTPHTLLMTRSTLPKGLCGLWKGETYQTLACYIFLVHLAPSFHCRCPIHP
jgi:hypothetical protein